MKIFLFVFILSKQYICITQKTNTGRTRVITGANILHDGGRGWRKPCGHRPLPPSASHSHTLEGTTFSPCSHFWYLTSVFLNNMLILLIHNFRYYLIISRKEKFSSSPTSYIPPAPGTHPPESDIFC